MVDAEELLHAGRLGPLTGAFAGIVFRLADVDEGAELLRLLGRAGIDRDEREYRLATAAEIDGCRTSKSAIVVMMPLGFVAVACSMMRAMSARSPGRGIAILDGHAKVLLGELDGVLDRVEPGVGIRSVGHVDEAFALSMRG